VTRAGARLRLNPAAAGKELGSATHEVTAEAIEAYARATSDLNERYLAGSKSVASPVWPVVPAFPLFMAAARDPELGADLRRLLHASEEHLLFGAIRPGDVLTVSGVLASITPHRAGEAFTVVVSERSANGVLAEVRGTMLIRGSATGEAGVRDDPPGHEVAHEHVTEVDDDQMQRYADASGDHNPIHLDRAAARRAGLRAPILHGMCTMAMVTKGAVDGLAGGDPTRVRRVRVEFSRPVLAGQRLTTRFRELDAPPGATLYGFETTADSGAVVVSDAEIEISR
jgi:acyl dehydratase